MNCRRRYRGCYCCYIYGWKLIASIGSWLAAVGAGGPGRSERPCSVGTRGRREWKRRRRQYRPARRYRPRPRCGWDGRRRDSRRWPWPAQLWGVGGSAPGGWRGPWPGSGARRWTNDIQLAAARAANGWNGRREHRAGGRTCASPNGSAACPRSHWITSWSTASTDSHPDSFWLPGCWENQKTMEN